VPQGSVLDPILFLIFIDLSLFAMANRVDYHVADDATLYSRININQPSIYLQHSLNRLSIDSLADSWKLAINLSKCCVLSLVIKKLSLVISTI
jgi:hypothetical protein